MIPRVLLDDVIEVHRSKFMIFDNKIIIDANNSRAKCCGTYRVSRVQPHSFGTETMRWQD